MSTPSPTPKRYPLFLLLLGLLLVPFILYVQARDGRGLTSEVIATSTTSANEGAVEQFLPIILKPGEPGVAPLTMARLLSTGQTVGYHGVSGVPAEGNGDDGDLIRGRLQAYRRGAAMRHSRIASPPTSSIASPPMIQLDNVVTDTNTGLMWLRDMTLLDGQEPAGLGGNVALNGTFSWQGALEACQGLLYAGFDDWHLPNLKALQTLVNYGRSEPSIDMDAFPTPFESYATPYFWTSTTFPAAPAQAFYVNFLNGHSYPFGKGTSFGLRCVRHVTLDESMEPIALLQTGQTVGYVGNEGETGEGNGDDGALQLGLEQRYQLQGAEKIETAQDNLVVDLNTELMWVRNPLLLTGTDAEGGKMALNEPLDWQSSIDRVNALSYGGYDDWRMPNLVELESISQAGRKDSLLEPTIFTNAPIDPNDPEAYIWWSSTTSAYDRNEHEPGKDAAWYVTSAFGSTNFVVYDYRPAKLRPGYVRPVRDITPSNSGGQAELFLQEVRSSADFNTLTLASSTANLLREGKFILPLNAPEAPFTAAYQNVNAHPLHYEFLLSAFPEQFAGMTPAEYTALVSLRETRQYWAGGLKSFTDAEGQTVYGFDIYTDATDENELLSLKETNLLYQRMLRTFRRRPLVYSPSRAAAIELALSWESPPFPIAFPTESASPDYQAYTVGQTYGIVRLMTLDELEEAAQDGALSRQEIVIVDSTPTDLESIVAGIVTGDRQGELSHLSIRTARRGTPNAYVKDNHAKFAGYNGQLVRMSITRSSYTIETDVSQAEAEAWWASQRPPTVTIRPPDTSYQALDDLAAIGANDEEGSATIRVGGKAANLARLYTFLPEAYQVPGFAIPFSAYEAFMQQNTLLDERVNPPVQYTYADYVTELHNDAAFRTDPELRADLLKDLRDEIEDNSTISPALVAEIAARVDQIFGEGVMVRFRSSSNAEDGLVFNGAGLYDSTSVCVLDSFDDDTSGPSLCDSNQDKERMIERGLRKVWASLWNFRAWEERDYYGIDQVAVSMAVLVTSAFPDERANGVAFTGDPTAGPHPLTPSPNFGRGGKSPAISPLTQSWERGAGGVRARPTDYLVNVQEGDVSVVLPDPGIIPERDQLVISEGQMTGIRRLRPSSLMPAGTWVMSDSELFTLGDVLLLANSQYPIELGVYQRDDVLLDLEFKIRRGDDQLLIKQIRPFLKSGPTLPGQSAILRVDTPQNVSMCGGWREGYELSQELAEETMLTLPAGDVEIPLAIEETGTLSTTHALFGDLLFGAKLESVAATGEGSVTIEPIGNEGQLRVTLAREYAYGEQLINITLSFGNIHAGEFDLRRLDEASLTSQLVMTGQIRDANSGEILSRLRLAPCGLSLLPLVEFDIQLAEERHLVLHQRREREDGVSGLAQLIAADITMPEGSLTISDYSLLTYAADRHHWNEKFLIRLDAPLGDIHAIAFYQQYTGTDEPQYSATLLNEALNTLREVEVEEVTRTVTEE